MRSTPQTLRDLEWSLRKPRSLFSYAMSMLTGAATIAALLPLFSVLFLLVKKGIEGLTWTAFTTLPPAAMSTGGGFGNALVGTFVIVRYRNPHQCAGRAFRGDLHHRVRA